MGNNKFAPDDPMTRAMLVTVLGRLHGVDTASYYKTSFTDVDSNKWYTPYVAWASEKGIVSGVGDNKFAPNDPVTREQISVIFANYARFIGFELPSNSPEIVFSDGNNISSWANQSVKSIQIRTYDRKTK